MLLFNVCRNMCQSHPQKSWLRPRKQKRNTQNTTTIIIKVEVEAEVEVEVKVDLEVIAVATTITILTLHPLLHLPLKDENNTDKNIKTNPFLLLDLS